MPGGQTVDFQVALPPAHPTALGRLLAAQRDPASPLYHHWLSPSGFDAEFGPSNATISAVEGWLRNRSIRELSVAGFDVQAAAPASAVTAALGTALRRYRTPRGVTGYVATSPPLVPTDLTGGSVQAIVGLTTLTRYRPLLVHGSTTGPAPAATATHTGGDGAVSACNAADAAASLTGGYTLDQIGSTYGIGSLLEDGQDGSGSTVGVYELAAHNPSDVAAYETCFGLSNPVNTVTNAAYPASLGGGGTVEADLDIEQIATQAPGARIESFEEGPDTSSAAAVDTWKQIVTADPPVVATSWGECEAAAVADGTMGAIQTYLEQAAAQGETVVAAAGDSGSEDCYDAQSGTGPTGLAVDFPASSQFVTSVGGTQFSGSGEDVWHAPGGVLGKGSAAGGGGVSAYWAASTADTTPGCNGTTIPCRTVPDLSAHAGEDMTIYADGTWQGGYGGTSFASPMVAGLLADANGGCSAHTTSGGRGDFNAQLATAQSTGTGIYGAGLTDVVSGDNDLTGSGEYTATTGYDEASGWGTPLAAGLSCPEVTSVVNDVGGTATVHGLGLEQATIEFGGQTASPVSTPTATSATVTLPPGTGTVTVSALATALGSGTQTVAYTFGGPDITTSSLPGATVGQPYSATLGTSGTTGSPVWSITGLPLPLTYDPSTGQITGTPLTAGTDPLSVTLSDGGGTSTADLSITTSRGQTTTGLLAPSSATVGSSFSVTAAVSPTSATGTVAFTQTGGTGCTASLSGGQATCSLTAGSTGTDTVSAAYAGSGDYLGSSTTGTVSVTTPPPAPPPAPAPSSNPVAASGYDLVGSDGGVFVFPQGQSGGFYGSLPGDGVHVTDVVGMVPSPDDRGYFLVGSDGGVFAFGDAPFLGSLPGDGVVVHDIAGIVPTADNGGYFLVGQDGGVFAFGDAPFLGSLPGEGVHVDDVIGIAATPSDRGYWVVAATGAVYAFGDARNDGSVQGSPSPVSGIAATPDGGGYWVVTRNGSVYGFGDAGYFGSLPGSGVDPAHPVIGLVPTADDQGYWLIGSDGGIFAYGDAPFVGSLPGLGVAVTDVVGAVPTRV